MVLTDAGANKVSVIKAVREITGLGLRKPRTWWTALRRTSREGIAQADAEAAVKKLVEAGAKAELNNRFPLPSGWRFGQRPPAFGASGLRLQVALGSARALETALRVLRGL